jgi:hypothetical protein
MRGLTECTAIRLLLVSESPYKTYFSEQDNMELKFGVLSGFAAKDYLFGKKVISDDPAVQLCWGSGYRAVRPQSFDEVINAPRCSGPTEELAAPAPATPALHRGRPRKSQQEKRAVNAARQRQFRAVAA